MEIIRNSLLNVAMKYSRELNYDYREDIEPTAWYERSNKKDKNVKFYNNLNQDNGYILVRKRFGNPRIDIYGNGREWFVSIEVSPNGEFKESQIFNPKGAKMFQQIYDDVICEISKL